MTGEAITAIILVALVLIGLVLIVRLHPLRQFPTQLKVFCADVNGTNFKTVTTEVLWFLTPPFLYFAARFLHESVFDFLCPSWLTALCAKSGVDYVRYKTDRETAFRPEERARASVLQSKAGVIASAPPEDAALIAASTPPSTSTQPGDSSDGSTTQSTN